MLKSFISKSPATLHRKQFSIHAKVKLVIIVEIGNHHFDRDEKFNDEDDQVAQATFSNGINFY